jgi:hypothetical protein
MDRYYWYYKDGVLTTTDDVLEWGKWFEAADRHVGNTYLPKKRRFFYIHISTVFLGLDHGYRSPDPVLWETMIFGGVHDQLQWRYTSEQEAQAGHFRAVRLAKRTYWKSMIIEFFSFLKFYYVKIRGQCKELWSRVRWDHSNNDSDNTV